MSSMAKTARGASLLARDWVVVNARRQFMRQQWRAFFRNYDVILCPVCVQPALKHDHRPFHERSLMINGREREYWDSTLWAGPAVMANLPSTSTPIGLTKSGLPVGLQVTGPYLEDKTCIEVAKMIRDVRGGFRLNAKYKNVDFTAQFSYSIGGHIYDNGYSVLMNNRDLIGSNNFHQDVRKAWKQPGDMTNVPRMTAGYNTDTQHNATSTRFLTKADFLSLNNLRIGYTLPDSAAENAGLKSLSFYVSGDNLMMLSARSGLNPTNFIASSNSGMYMPMTTFSLGTKIQF